MRIFICDDESFFCDTLSTITTEYIKNQKLHWSVTVCHSGEELLSQNIHQMDVCFLDIEMPGEDGIQVADIIRNTNPLCKIIFVSSHQEYVQTGYKVRAYRFLYKPINERDVIDALQDLEREAPQEGGILITDKYGETKVKYRNIYWIESMGDGTALHRQKDYLTVNTTMSKLEEELSDQFFRCHKSYMVNFDYIHKIDDKTRKIILTNHVEIQISFRKKNELKEQYKIYLKKKAGWI